MSGMTLGSIIGAERRVKDYEVRMRRLRRVRKDAEVWRKYEEDYANQGKSHQRMQGEVNQVAKKPAVQIGATDGEGLSKKSDHGKRPEQANGS